MIRGPIYYSLPQTSEYTKGRFIGCKIFDATDVIRRFVGKHIHNKLFYNEEHEISFVLEYEIKDHGVGEYKVVNIDWGVLRHYLVLRQKYRLFEIKHKSYNYKDVKELRYMKESLERIKKEYRFVELIKIDAGDYKHFRSVHN